MQTCFLCRQKRSDVSFRLPLTVALCDACDQSCAVGDRADAQVVAVMDAWIGSIATGEESLADALRAVYYLGWQHALGTLATEELRGEA